MTTEVSGPGAIPVSAFVADAVASIAAADTNLLEVADGLDGSDVGAQVVHDAHAWWGSSPNATSSPRWRSAWRWTRRLCATSPRPNSCGVVRCRRHGRRGREEMCDRYVRHIPVEEDGRRTGIVSARDLLGVYTAVDVEVDQPQKGTT